MHVCVLFSPDRTSTLWRTRGPRHRRVLSMHLPVEQLQFVASAASSALLLALLVVLLRRPARRPSPRSSRGRQRGQPDNCRGRRRCGSRSQRGGTLLALRMLLQQLAHRLVQRFACAAERGWQASAFVSPRRAPAAGAHGQARRGCWACPPRCAAPRAGARAPPSGCASTPCPARQPVTPQRTPRALAQRIPGRSRSSRVPCTRLELPGYPQDGEHLRNVLQNRVGASQRCRHLAPLRHGFGLEIHGVQDEPPVAVQRVRKALRLLREAHHGGGAAAAPLPAWAQVPDNAGERVQHGRRAQAVVSCAISAGEACRKTRRTGNQARRTTDDGRHPQLRSQLVVVHDGGTEAEAVVL